MTSAASFRTSDYVIAIVATAVGHVLFFFLFVVLALVQILSPPPEPVAATVVPEVMVEIHPEMFQRPEPKKEVQPERDRFARTLPTQEVAEEARETNLIGEHNTKATSDRPPDANAPLRPSLAGVEPRRPNEMNTFDANFQDGVEPTVQPQEQVEATNPPGEEVPPQPVEEMAQKETPPTEPLPPAAPPEELLVTENRVPVPELDGPGEERREESLPRETPAEPDPKSVQQPGGESAVAKERKVEASDEDPGFRGEVRKTRIRGAIGRNGDASAEVKNTPLGRYQALLNRAVEREWQLNCVRYRDLITPGILTIRFLVNEEGKVSGFRFLEVVEAGEIQKGFTLNAIKAASIPAMPPVLEKDLDGEPLELIYNFYF